MFFHVRIVMYNSKLHKNYLKIINHINTNKITEPTCNDKNNESIFQTQLSKAQSFQRYINYNCLPWPGILAY